MDVHLVNPLSLELLISEEAILSSVAEVCQNLDREYAGKELVIVMVMKGAICLVADLIRHLQVPCSIEFVQGRSYGERGIHRGELTVFGLDNFDVSNKHVLLVDDIYDSGYTLSAIHAKLLEKQPSSLKTLVLLSKNVPRQVVFQPDYILFHIENRFVVGYGLDFKEYYRGLPGVYALHQEN
jgi:hypoxanthine phosphoribosyltransferase